MSAACDLSAGRDVTPHSATRRSNLCRPDLRVEELCYTPPPVPLVNRLSMAQVIDWAKLCLLRLRLLMLVKMSE